MPKKKRSKKRVKKRVVKEPTESSSKAIEESYAQEKQIIDQAIKNLERKRMEDYIALLDKKKAAVTFKKKKLTKLEKDITYHAKAVKGQINRLSRKKTTEKTHFDRLYVLNEHLRNIQSQIKDIVVSRKTLLQKEKELLNESKKFFKDNSDELRYYGLRKLKKIKEILDKKTKIIKATTYLLDEELASIFADKKILEKITDEKLARIYDINLLLQKLTENHRNLLKKKQAMKIDDKEFEHMLADLNSKRKKLVAELKKIR